MPGPVGNNQTITCDAYGHTVALPGPTLATGGASTVAAIGTITVNATGGGAGSSLAYAAGQTATDMGGTFQVTTAGVPAAGTVATVTFNNPLQALPKAILCTYAASDGSAAGVFGASAITVTGFNLVAATALAAAKNINTSFEVVM